MTVTYILWVVLECVIFSAMVASSGESSGGVLFHSCFYSQLSRDS